MVEPISEEEYNCIMSECESHINNLRLITQTVSSSPEGSSYYLHGSFEVCPEKKDVRMNLMTLAKKCDRILEIGFNMGHSCLFMLVANPKCVVDCFDICQHPYVEHCFKYLSDKFPNRLTLHKGDSRTTVGEYKGIPDLCHIDGSHDFIPANLDFFNCRNLSKNGTFIVFDDMWIGYMQDLWRGYIQSGLVVPVEIIPTTQHAIGMVKKTERKIAVCTLALGEEYKTITAYGRMTKVYYCNRHGYDFRDDEDAHDKTRPYAWSKVKLIQKCLNQNYEYVVWIDADTHIMNPDITLESLIDRLSGGKDILLASDWDKINSGVMFIKNTEWSKKFFETLYDQTEFLNHPNWEQEGIIHMYNTNMIRSQEHIMKLHFTQQTEFNSYYSLYKKGQFLIHLAGCYRDDRNNGLDMMMDRYCPIRMAKDTDATYQERMRFLDSLV